jgi:hypothetical protein
MTTCSMIITPLVALAITFFAMQVAAVATGVLRRRDYRHFEDKSRDFLLANYAFPEIAPSSAEERRKSLSPFVDKAHRAANATQTAYHNAVVRSAGCLALAFLALAAGTLHPQAWPLMATSSAIPPELLLSWLDTISLFFVLILYIYGRKVCYPWIASRTGAELLRQYQMLYVIFPSALSGSGTKDVNREIEIEADLISARVQKDSISNIGVRVEQFWLARRRSIENNTLQEADVTAAGLLVYLTKRARRQLGWFMDSNGRLEHIAERRKIVLLFLYCIAIGLAVFKHAMFLHHEHVPAFLEALLLLVTGMSAAMTAYYINQNSRSLIHRYNAQKRYIIAWLRTFNDRWKVADLPEHIIDPTSKNDIRALILQFEDMMIEELIDWIQITNHDAIELAP